MSAAEQLPRRPRLRWTDTVTACCGRCQKNTRQVEEHTESTMKRTCYACSSVIQTVKIVGKGDEGA